MYIFGLLMKVFTFLKLNPKLYILHPKLPLTLFLKGSWGNYKGFVFLPSKKKDAR